MENSSPTPSFSICDIRIQKRGAECFAKSFPQKIVLAKPSPHFASPHCPNTWRAEPRKKNTLSFFKRNFTPAKSEMQGVFFLSGLPRLCEAVAGRFIPRQDCFQKRFEFCTMNTANFRKGFQNQKYGRREAPSVLHSPQKILILQGFATLRVAPRLPIQFYE